MDLVGGAPDRRHSRHQVGNLFTNCAPRCAILHSIHVHSTANKANMTQHILTATRYHDICAGHRVFGHESKCAHIHGHGYRIHFEIRGALDQLGRILDFSVMKAKLCMWLEENWDHRMLVWDQDPIAHFLYQADPTGLVPLPFNPTAENMAHYLLLTVGPEQLAGTGCELVRVVVEETPKCHAIASLA